MAFRIHDSMVRGEIDNRIKGIVRGKVWLEGRSERRSAEQWIKVDIPYLAFKVFPVV